MRDLISFKNTEELSNFLEKEETREDEKLEFKESLNHIKKKDVKDFVDAYFEVNFVKAIYAMANTKGGNVLIGISDGKEIIGIRKGEVDFVEKTIKTIQKIAGIETEIKKLEFTKRRVVLNIIVKKGKPYQKVITKKGIIYYREGSSSQSVKSNKDLEKLYGNEQFYNFYSEGIRENLKSLKNDTKTDFDIDNYIIGLQKHIKEDKNREGFFIFGKNIKKLLELSSEIKKELIIKKKTTDIDQEEPEKKNIDEHIKEFIEIYKESIN